MKKPAKHKSKIANETIKQSQKGPAKLQAGIAARRLAVKALMQVETKKSYANLSIAASFANKDLNERDRAFVTALVNGILRHQLALDEQLGLLSNKPIDKLPSALRNILRLGIFQLQQMPNIPCSAVLNTCNDLAKLMGHPGHAKFANAILRNYLRAENLDKTDEAGTSQLSAKSIPEQLCHQFSMPLWLVAHWLDRYGLDETKLLLAKAQEIPKLSLRTCELAITTDGLKDIFQNKGIVCHKGQLIDSCLIIDDRKKIRGPVSKLPGYAEGLFTVQDEAAAFVSKVVDPKPGELIIDLCAAPGGKSLHLGELMNNKGRVIALDNSASRLQLLRPNRQRLGLTNIEIIEADARSYQSTELADRVLLDAPCSGTGVIGRRSDLRLNKQALDLVSLVTLQRQLLENAASLLKDGGILVYSTCSIEPEENLENLNWFLSHHPNFETEDISSYVSKELIADWSQRGYDPTYDLQHGSIQLLPSRHNVSGFFIFRLKKEARIEI